jgi:hypothetical protein
VPYGLLGVLRHQGLQLGLGGLVFRIGRSGAAEDTGEFGLGIGRAHVDNPHRLNAGARWLGVEETRGLAVLDAAPELLFRGQKDVLVEGIRRNRELDPLAAPVMIERAASLALVTQMLCWSWAMCFSLIGTTKLRQ